MSPLRPESSTQDVTPVFAVAVSESFCLYYCSYYR